jgi:hypothetical protein
MIPKVTFSDGSNNNEMLFFIMYRMHSANVPGKNNHIWKPVYKSEIKLNQQNTRETVFVWSQYSIMVNDICSSDLDKEIKIEVFRSQKNGRHVN